jgi:O-antigen/teichoic acid export membrane protein
MANLFMGIYFNLSLWYKITDKTRYGAYQGLIGSVITLIINIALVPFIGYYASAIAILVSFIVMTMISYVSGMKHYPINYDLKGFAFYLILSTLLFLIYWTVRTDSNPSYWLATLVNVVFIGVIVWKEKKELFSIIKS